MSTRVTIMTTYYCFQQLDVSFSISETFTILNSYSTKRTCTVPKMYTPVLLINS